jgi:hypothetical protein
VLAYGAGFVAQATPADMPGMTALIEEALRYPGFSFVNIQSPCVTFGEEDQQLREHKARMKPLASLGHNPGDQLRALDLARAYGTELYTGVLFRNPQPPATYDALSATAGGLSRTRAPAGCRPLLATVRTRHECHPGTDFKARCARPRIRHAIEEEARPLS